jgi:hypothetical protein
LREYESQFTEKFKEKLDTLILEKGFSTTNISCWEGPCFFSTFTELIEQLLIFYLFPRFLDAVKILLVLSPLQAFVLFVLKCDCLLVLHIFVSSNHDAPWFSHFSFAIRLPVDMDRTMSEHLRIHCSSVLLLSSLLRKIRDD